MSKNRALDHRSDWSTPKDIFDEWNNQFGFSDFDPCPIDGNIKGYDGLKDSWEDRTFINPPYDLKAKTAFVKHGVAQTIINPDLSFCYLLPVSTSTALFKDVIEPNVSEILFLRGRLKFEGVNKDGVWVNPGTGRKPHPAAEMGLETTTGCGQHDSFLIFFGAWQSKNQLITTNKESTNEHPSEII